MKILALDTATENCSACLWLDGVMLHREIEAERGHAELILGMIDELLREAATRLGDMDAIAFGRGPGSFTGVRLAASVTQGLAFGAGVPVVPISDLRAVAQRVAAPRVLVCNDARMQEVYWACFEQDASGLMQPIGLERVSKPSDVHLPEHWAHSPGGVPQAAAASQYAPPSGTHTAAPDPPSTAAPPPKPTAVGRGFAAYPLLSDSLSDRLASIDATSLPRAREVASLAVSDVREGRVLPPEQAVPVYIRDDVARPKAPPGNPQGH